MAPRGTKPKRKQAAQTGATKHPAGNKKPPKASQPGSDGKGNTKKRGKLVKGTLNPQFDPRMRRVGSPLNLSSRIKRGWIQAEDTNERVNFLFNPSQLDLSHTIDPNQPRLDSQAPPDDVTDPYYTSSGSTTGVKLLYDRTYELFSPGGRGHTNLASTMGVWADVAAWYVFLGMIDSMPTDWNTLITQPAQLKRAYLFVGPKLPYYGWVTSLNVTYSHWTQEMIPQRCSVDIGFQILPHLGSNVPAVGATPKGGDTWNWLDEFMAVNGGGRGAQ